MMGKSKAFLNPVVVVLVGGIVWLTWDYLVAILKFLAFILIGSIVKLFVEEILPFLAFAVLFGIGVAVWSLCGYIKKIILEKSQNSKETCGRSEVDIPPDQRKK